AGIPSRFSSVFFGGGTPGLFAEEFAPLFKVMSPLLAPGAEISLEANPGNISRQNLSIWRSLGFNRLSLGVQSFQAAGLRTLVRDHDDKQALAAIEAAGDFFPNLNIDLIYGWPGQSHDQWRSDLEIAVKAGVPH